MKQAVGSPTAILLDDDVAFLLWLGDLFYESGYQAIPALNGRQAVALSRQVDLGVSVLLVNPQLRGAQRTIETLASANPRLRVVLIRDPSESGGATAGDRPSIQRPRASEPISRTQWLAKIRTVLTSAAAT